MTTEAIVQLVIYFTVVDVLILAGIKIVGRFVERNTP